METVQAWLRGIDNDRYDAEIVERISTKLMQALIDLGGRQVWTIPEATAGLIKTLSVMLATQTQAQSPTEVRKLCREMGRHLSAEVLVFRTAAEHDGITRHG